MQYLWKTKRVRIRKQTAVCIITYEIRTAKLISIKSENLMIRKNTIFEKSFRLKCTVQSEISFQKSGLRNIIIYTWHSSVLRVTRIDSRCIIITLNPIFVIIPFENDFQYSLSYNSCDKFIHKL